MRAELVNQISSLTKLSLESVEKMLGKPKITGHGDLAFPCFPLAKEWQCSPQECAVRLAENLRLPEGIERSEPTGPYLNFFFDRGLYAKQLLTELLQPAERKHDTTPIIVEYSSPNIAKPFHVGHIRGILIGQALDKTLRHMGHEVISINHLGDWGTQFGFVYAGCEIWGTPSEETVAALVGVYKRATTLKKAQEDQNVPSEDSDKPDVNEMARDYFKRLEAGEPEAVTFWEWCLEISMVYFRTIYNDLGVSFDHYTGESFFRDKLEDVETQLKNSGVLEDSRGALGVDLGKKLGFVRIFTEDGRSLYVTRDLATADYRHKTFKPQKILYVVGAPQTLYFQQLIAVLEKIDHPASQLMVHIPFGHVPGISTRGKTQDSDRTLLEDFIADARTKALEAYHTAVSKRPEDVDEQEVARAVGLGAIVFHFLSRSNIKDFHFNWDDALNFQGDTGPYLQYAYARLCSIEAKATQEGIKPDPTGMDASALTDNDAYEIISLLADFSSVLEKVAIDYEPQHLAHYLLAVAKRFSSGYRGLRVLGEENKAVAQARLTLFSATRQVLYQGLTALGVPPLEKM